VSLFIAVSLNESGFIITVIILSPEGHQHICSEVLEVTTSEGQRCHFPRTCY
jgi:hypothetical protein